MRASLIGISAFAAVVLWPAPFSFDELQPALFGTPGALVNAFADIDGDGDSDLFVGFNGIANRLYLNEGGVFRDVAAELGVADARATRAAAFGDWDGDGDADLVVGFAPAGGTPTSGNAAQSVLTLYRNDGTRFVNASEFAQLNVSGGAVRQLAWVDFDADGDLDLFVAFRDRANALYQNDDGRLTDIAEAVGLADTRRSVGAVWADLDADGDLDLVVGNMDGDRNGVFRNDDGHFTDVAEAWGLAWGGRTPDVATLGTVRPCVGDVNGDGKLDLITANYGTPGLFLAIEKGEWKNVAADWGIAVDGRYDSCALADVDHDGRLDLYLNGTVTQGKNWPDYLYRNAGRGFVDSTPASVRAVPADHGVQWADVDGDGAADLALTGEGPHALLRNSLAPAIARRALRIRVVDEKGRATRAGAEIRVYARGTRTLLATRMVDAGSGYNSQSDIPVHVGLASTGLVDIEVTWPAAGERRVTSERDVVVDGRRVITIRVR